MSESLWWNVFMSPSFYVSMIIEILCTVAFIGLFKHFCVIPLCIPTIKFKRIFSLVFFLHKQLSTVVDFQDLVSSSARSTFCTNTVHDIKPLWYVQPPLDQFYCVVTFLHLKLSIYCYFPSIKIDNFSGYSITHHLPFKLDDNFSAFEVLGLQQSNVNKNQIKQ